ncbi:insect cuticle protein domain-containing protein [Phthorimaea operculella]|nr:insect cuticle protein domain-containing protein [Phthorimaea operculella]
MGCLRRRSATKTTSITETGTTDSGSTCYCDRDGRSVSRSAVQLMYSQFSDCFSNVVNIGDGNYRFSRNGVLATPFRYDNQVNNGDGNYRFSRNGVLATPFRYDNHVNNGDGNYRFSYDANGISAHESGSPRAPGPEGPAVTSEGGYSYRAPDGQQISLTYTADENGFHPVGSHLPTPPPIPDAILRSLEYNRQHPSNDDGSYNPGRAGYQY